MPGLVKGFNCRGASAGDIDGVTFFDQILFDRVRHLGLVVDNKNPHISIFHNSLLGSDLKWRGGCILYSTPTAQKMPYACRHDSGNRALSVSEWRSIVPR